MPTAGSRRGVQSEPLVLGVRGAKPVNLLFASRMTIICVICNCELSERKIVLPIDCATLERVP